MNSSLLSQTAQIYGKRADNYETRWSGYLTHTHQKFLAEVSIAPGEVILDLSCGTGLLAQHIIDRGDTFQKLVLNDISAKMQQYARNRLATQKDTVFTSFPAGSIDFPAAAFDKIFCLNAFHNYPNQPQVLNECYRSLKPGGALFVLDWNRSGGFRPINWLISKTGAEHINTRSASEMRTLLKKHSFSLSFTSEWYFRYWKFFYAIGKKEDKE
ncbi:MAG TPA: class I SAM-dependent methyltransferase [Fodinibius sp.]|nr:class I SAM-dependent methyltransferase [Fodinibius sp.]